RRNIYGGICDDKDLMICRNVHQERVAYPPACTQALLTRYDRRHEFVGMQTALHKDLGTAFSDKLNRFLGGGVAVRHIDDLRNTNIDACFGGHRVDFLKWTDQDRVDQA